MTTPGMMIRTESARVLRDALTITARAGFGGAELGAGPGQACSPERLLGLGTSGLLAHARELGLRVLALDSPATLAASGAERREGLDTAGALVETCHALGAPAAVITPTTGDVGPSEDSWRYLLDSLHDLATSLSRSGVRLLLAVGGGGSIMTSLEICRLVRREKPGEVGLCLAEGFPARFPSPEHAAAELAGDVGSWRLRATHSGKPAIENVDCAGTVARTLLDAGFAGPMVVTQGSPPDDAESAGRLRLELERLIGPPRIDLSGSGIPVLGQ